MIKLAALFVLAVTLMFGEGWGGARAAEPVCITITDLLTYQRESPPPFPSAWVMGELEGDRAQKFVVATGGAQVAPLTGFVYFFQAPTERPGQVLALLADPEGCAILMSGERTLTAGKSAGVVLQTWQLRKLLMGLFGTPLSV